MKLPFISSYAAIPLVLLSVLAMMILPLPPWLIDTLFTFNIVLAVLVLLVAVSAKRPLDFSVFPSILLIATLMRLTLNVASTRVVLLNGHNGSDAAGKVIQSFGEVVIGGNYVVGMVVFVILMIINFVVITKGGERISEVAARFTLDALPGKQMAIDADLNAGVIDQGQAKQRRQDVASEADFYGAMDGASKFVRGDAIAGLMILVINLLGGLAIGVFQHHLSGSDAFKLYALLTIGDGLVAQIPSLLLATAAAIIVTRVNDESEMSDQVHQQLLASPRVIWTAAAVMVMLGIIPGMPTAVFLGFGAVLAFAGWRQGLVKPEQTPAQDLEELSDKLTREQPLAWGDLPYVDTLSIDLGYRLVTLVDKSQGAELLARVRGVRKILSEQMGFLVPEVRIRDNLQLGASEYRIKLGGVMVSQGEVDPERLMAIQNGDVYGKLDGELTIEPAYQMDAVLIAVDQKAKALNLGYSVVDSATVIATHLGKVMREHLEEIFSHDDVIALGDRLKSHSEKLFDSLNAQLTPIQQLRVYRQLLADQVSLMDIRTIATTLVDSCELTKDPILLAADVRYALRRSLIKAAVGDKEQLVTMTLDDKLEQTLLKALNQAQAGGKVALDSFPIEPSLLGKLQQVMPQLKDEMQRQGHSPVLLVTPQLRPLLARYARTFARGLKVLSYNEVPEKMHIDVVGTLG
ncbi:flagellar biosynthesis protein FlhA [Gallaecimonas pentaromativorans]|uniref:Flagellar biosynthesis protein FlhA n=1 Tax=Gallaecimonas pentaromativorans TaxID=584787 RepID=A0A3N1PCP3_9GAMM|nr:flagellar biosynthesis protein FlhA [Gallaecimonas pentaromativorans]ROQ25859.1 flagellar biosynthesis protein FlhA [Gallaecimonas pentaromativorans]